jgi:hypothetical protein
MATDDTQTTDDQTATEDVKTEEQEDEPVVTTTQDVYEIRGEDLVNKVKEAVQDRKVRKITVLDKDGKELLVIPLAVGAVGVLAAPMLAAVGALAALLTSCTIRIDRTAS